jgi:hypothetical protein
MVDDNNIVGHNSGIPCFYHLGAEKILSVCNVDTMIAKSHRGIENLYDLMDHAYKKYKQDGIKFVYGFPNDNSYPLLTQLSFMDNIGKLDTYCLPYRIGGIKRQLNILNFASKFFCKTWVNITSIFASRDIVSFEIEKESESYNLTRYKRNDGKYSIVHLDKFSFVYKIITYENIRTAFLIDVMEKSANNYCKAVKYLLKNESINFDLILYVGSLPFKKNGFVKFPRKFEPKHFHFTAKIFDNKLIDSKTFCNINSWDVNLSNYDLI